jgi:ABC-type multidrug transport system fused ATPase/permease subunit
MMDRRDRRIVGFLLRRFVRPYTGAFALVVCLNLIIGIALTLRPLVLAPAFDAFVTVRAPSATRLGELTLNNVGPTLSRVLGVDPANPLRTAVQMAGILVLVTVIVAVLSLTGQIVLAGARTALHRDMLVALHQHLLTLPLAYFHKRRTGELVSRLTQDVTGVSGALDSPVRGVAQALAQVTMAFVIMFRTSATFTLAILGMGCLHFLITRALATRIRHLARTVSDRQGDVGARLQETFAGMRVVKSFAAEAFDSAKLRAAAEAFRRLQRRSRIVSETDLPIRMVADTLMAAVVLVLTFREVSQARLTLPAAVLFFYLSQQLVAPLSLIFRQWLSLAHVQGLATRIVEMFETQASMPDGRELARPLRDRIRVEGVSFAFEGGRPVLAGVELEILRGQTVAIVGPSGSGKTTLGDLLLRLYDVEQGVIRYDGRDIREFRQASYRAHFGVVPQDPLLFNATVRENIVFNRREDPAALAHAVWVANAEEFVRELPQGLDTPVGDRGVRLSGGQRQRIAIARAIYARPSVLVLDEATSSLDSESEREVQKAIERVGHETTMVVIAHRLSTVFHADQIAVLNRGRLEAVGRHEAVLASSPTYRRLYRLQAAEPVA